MNVQLANTISDLSGATGMAILRAILSGVRDPWQLAKLRDRRIQASEAEIAASLEGNWREDVLFELRQVVEGYDFYQRQICGGDQELEKRMAAAPARQEATAADKLVRRAKARGNQPQFDLAGELRRTLGVDLTTVDGIDVMTAQVFLSEVGPELGAFPSEDHFAAWLELAPRRDVSGGKVIRHVKPVHDLLAQVAVSRDLPTELIDPRTADHVHAFDLGRLFDGLTRRLFGAMVRQITSLG